MDVETSCQERLFPQVDDRGRSPLAQRRHFSRPGEMHGDPARVAAAMRFTSEPTVVRPPPWLSGNFAAENDAHSPQASSAGIDSLTLGATISSRQLGASAIWGGRAMRQNMADKNRASPQNVTAADGSTQPVRTNISGSSLRPVNLHSDYRFDSSALTECLSGRESSADRACPDMRLQSSNATSECLSEPGVRTVSTEQHRAMMDQGHGAGKDTILSPGARWQQSQVEEQHRRRDMWEEQETSLANPTGLADLNVLHPRADSARRIRASCPVPIHGILPQRNILTGEGVEEEDQHLYLVHGSGLHVAHQDHGVAVHSQTRHGKGQPRLCSPPPVASQEESAGLHSSIVESRAWGNRYRSALTVKCAALCLLCLLCTIDSIRPTQLPI
jgi:hypothetical protein